MYECISGNVIKSESWAGLLANNICHCHVAPKTQARIYTYIELKYNIVLVLENSNIVLVLENSSVPSFQLTRHMAAGMFYQIGSTGLVIPFLCHASRNSEKDLGIHELIFKMLYTIFHSSLEILQ